MYSIVIVGRGRQYSAARDLAEKILGEHCAAPTLHQEITPFGRKTMYTWIGRTSVRPTDDEVRAALVDGVVVSVVEAEVSR